MLEDLKCKGAALARVVSPPPLRNRRFSRVGGEECKGVMEKLEEEEQRVEVSKAPLLGKRDGSPKEKGGKGGKVDEGEGEKRARRGRSGRSEEGDPERVGCKAGCLQMLGRPG
mgnify:FL=1